MMIILHHLQLQVQQVFVKRFFQKTLDQASIQSYVPKHTHSLLQQYQKQYGSFHHWEYVLGLIKISFTPNKSG